MESNKIKCICNETFALSNFHNHFGKCPQFITEFKDFDLTLSKMLLSYSKQKEKLIIVKYLFKLNIEMINNKLKMMIILKKIKSFQLLLFLHRMKVGVKMIKIKKMKLIFLYVNYVKLIPKYFI